MKKIALFVDNLFVGGIQKSAVNLMKELNPNEFSIDLYIFNKDNFYDIPNYINVINVKRPAKIYQFLPFNLVKKLMKIKVNNLEYDIAIDFDSYQMHTAIGALTCNAKKKAIWVHNDIPIKLKEEFKYRILHFFFKKKYNYFDSYCGVSKGAIDAFKTIENHPNKEYWVIPNYINTTEISQKLKEPCDLKIENDKINIVCVGRLCHQKGYDIMLNNIKKLTNYRHDFHLYIIGDGPERNKLNKQITKLNLNSYVTFLGNQKNPFKYLKLMDIFYLSSRYEGQGMVILEAMFCGLDILIPKHLEKYCPNAKGTENIINYLKEYKKHNNKKMDDLKEYNNNITIQIKKMIK